MPRTTIAGLLTVTALAALAANRAAAHHSFAALFDATKTVAVTGQVIEFHFEAPHSYIELAVTGEDGESVTWEIETATPGMLIRKGVTPDTIRPGDSISATGNPTRDGRPLLRLTTLVMADGTELEIQ